MKYIRILLLLICLQPLTSIWGQQETQFTQYTFNQGLINPAYMGSIDYTNLQLSNRNQWLGFPGAPKSNAITVAYPFKYFSSAVGITAMQDKVGPLSNTMLTLGYSYTINVSSKLRLAMGLRGGANLYSANLDKLQTNDSNDGVLQQGTVQHSSFTVGAGLFLYSSKWYIGVSVPKLVTNSFSFSGNGVDDDVFNLKERNHLYLISGYVFSLSGENVKLKPSVCLKKVQNVDPTIDISLATMLYNTFSIGGGIRNPDTFFAFLQIAAGKNVKVGYAYDFSKSQLSNFSNGSHEIILGLNLYRDATKIHSPRFF
ncbi:PorP/SprF family type IX secretion system membrane protein [Saccharicrinis aurantiacus]|uniref:PorP/SprF family type IX secretion system membrane protein n=1 Tax=Saccharicrinis aurantiacus TaxID=1849719 RepID=UPI0009502DDA|nr:type IX secretion system membrane protein PorP/SprF [Saccharicrinis aurantiacus]